MIDDFQERRVASAAATFEKERDLLDSAFRTGVRMLEQTVNPPEARAIDQYRRAVEGLWENVFEVIRKTDSQFRKLDD